MRYSRLVLCFQVKGDFLQMLPHKLLKNPPPNKTKPLTVVDLVSDSEDDESWVSAGEYNGYEYASFYEIENQPTIDQEAREEAAAKQKALEEALAKRKALEEALAKRKALEEAAAAAAKQKVIEDANAKRKQLEDAADAKQKARYDTIAKLKSLEEAATAAAKQKAIEDDAAKRNAIEEANQERDNTQNAPTKAVIVNQEEICLRTSKRAAEQLENGSNKQRRISEGSEDSSVYSVVDLDKTFEKTLVTKEDSPNTDPDVTSDSSHESAVTILQSMSTDVQRRGIQRLERNDLEIYPSPYRSLKGHFIGRGVRTRIFIRKGAFICRYNGTITDKLNHQHRPYVLQLSNQSYLDCYQNATTKPTKCIASMINTANRLVDPKTKTKLDSKKNNCELRFQPTIVSVYALRDIQVGEELLVAYNCQVDLMR